MNCVFLFLFLSFTASASLISNSKLVNYELFYEVFCGGCQDIIVQELHTVLESVEMQKAVNVTLYPAGNVKIVSKDPIKITCQHGETECYGNKLEGCAIKKNPSLTKWFQFIYCMELSGYGMIKNETVMDCAKKAEIDGSEVLTCANSHEGDVIHLWNAEHTPSDHTYVPWTLINGKLFKGMDLMTALCDEIVGPKPDVCTRSRYALIRPQSVCKVPVNTLSLAPVAVNLYYESLCPGCQQVITEDLTTIINDREMIKIVNITLVPYGNGRIISKDPIKIQCQHGEEECYGNRLEGCAILHYPTTPAHFPFIRCVELLHKYTDEAIIKCAKESSVDESKILECAKGDEGQRIHLANALATPSHEYVPWITLNKEVFPGDDLIQGICDAYGGAPKPKLCDNGLSEHKRFKPSFNDAGLRRIHKGKYHHHRNHHHNKKSDMKLLKD